jgi:hypothetical protein
MVAWAEQFDARILLHEHDRAWVMDPSERILHWSGDRLRVSDRLELGWCFGLLGNSLFMATLDAHVIALDRANGDILWDTTLADFRQGDCGRTYRAD